VNVSMQPPHDKPIHSGSAASGHTATGMLVAALGAEAGFTCLAGFVAFTPGSQPRLSVLTLRAILLRPTRKTTYRGTTLESSRHQSQGTRSSRSSMTSVQRGDADERGHQ
jgi:hypothetical protein